MGYGSPWRLRGICLGIAAALFAPAPAARAGELPAAPVAVSAAAPSSLSTGAEGSVEAAAVTATVSVDATVAPAAADAAASVTVPPARPAEPAIATHRHVHRSLEVHSRPGQAIARAPEAALSLAPVHAAQ